MMERRIGLNFRLLDLIGEGSFGKVYKGLDISTNEEVAVKMEPIRVKSAKLLNETKLYKVLQGHPGIIKVHKYGLHEGHAYMVMPLLGENLEQLFHRCGKHFSLTTTAALAVHLIDIIKFVHSRGYIHRDIKPENFLIDRKIPERIYLIDFGLALKYINGGQHIPYSEDKRLTGTLGFSSVNTHLGIQQSRRDDLEALGHMLVYFLTGSLPWHDLEASTCAEKCARVFEKKFNTSTEELCKDLPEELRKYMEYCRYLDFEADPDYELLKSFFVKLIEKVAGEKESVFDWHTKSTDSFPI